MAQLVVLNLIRSNIIRDNEIVTSLKTEEIVITKLKENIVRLFCIAQCNAFTICNALNVQVGIGLFPDAAMLNHSCLPNCIVHFNLTQRKLIIRTIEPILAGQELTVSCTHNLSRMQLISKVRYRILTSLQSPAFAVTSLKHLTFSIVTAVDVEPSMYQAIALEKTFIWKDTRVTVVLNTEANMSERLE